MRNINDLSKKWGKPCITRPSTRHTKTQRGQIEGSRKIDFINSNHKTAGCQRKETPEQGVTPHAEGHHTMIGGLVQEEGATDINTQSKT